jgi:hypothetical protein
MTLTPEHWIIPVSILASGVTFSIIILADGIAMWLNSPDEEHPNDNHDN